MIKFENTEVYGWEAAIRGMRNPMNSWDKSDSTFLPVYAPPSEYVPEIGENDIKLMQKLVKAGADHSKFLRMINVTLDITAPLYWWKEFDTYKVGTVTNSCSTMHKITAKEFVLDDFSHEHLNDLGKNNLILQIDSLNAFRHYYLGHKDKDIWWQMIQLLPSSYNQRRTVMLNYQVLKNMYHSRNNHKLDEWRKFCEWIESLPYSELITEKNI
jgi:hypothetical protein